MDFFDFEIRAWQVDRSHVEVLVHSSPAGDMREPVKVPFSARRLRAIHEMCEDCRTEMPSRAWRRLVTAGQELADVLLPRDVHILLVRSLERIREQDGLRVRLCLDGRLMDYPWEYLHTPDAPSGAPAAGFLALDSRVSLVREAPRSACQPPARERKLRLLFAGVPFVVDGDDLWRVDEERQQLVSDLEPVSDVLRADAVMGTHKSIEAALSGPPVDIFHYSGHTDDLDGQGFLVEDLQADEPAKPAGYMAYDRPEYREQYGVDKLYFHPLYSERLGSLLRAAETRLAVFSACNSGHWAFVEPLIRAGGLMVIGTQGWISVPVALAFCHKLYSPVAVGLSLDEAITWARLHLIEPGVLPEGQQWHWGVFAVYMPTAEAVLFPKTEDAARQRQEEMRGARQQTIINVYQHIGTVEPGGHVEGVSTDQPGKPQ